MSDKPKRAPTLYPPPMYPAGGGAEVNWHEVLAILVLAFIASAFGFAVGLLVRGWQ